MLPSFWLLTDCSTALMTAIANYPLSLSVDASNDSVWQDYSGGVVTGHCR